MPPTITVVISSPVISIVDVGDTIRLPCRGYHVVTKLPIIVRWSKENGKLPEKAVEDHGTLFITNAQYADSGVYICQAHDGRDIVKDKVTVAVGSKLHIKSSI